MKKSRFNAEQIIGIVKEHESGLKASDVARKHGGSEHTIYRWRSKYGGLSVSEAARLKELDDENRKRKQVVAEQLLDIRALKVALGKNY